MKKLFSMLLASAMLMSLLAACGGSGTSDAGTAGNGDTAPAVTETDDGDGDAAPAEATDTDGWPAIGSADAPVPVNIVIKDVFPGDEGVPEYLDAIMTMMASHGQYVDLALLEPPASDYATAMPLMVRSGETEADIVYFQGNDLPLAQEGLLIDLTDYIAGSTYMKDMLDETNKEKMANYPYLVYLATPRVPIPVMRSDFVGQLETYDALMADPTVDNYYAFFEEMVSTGLVNYATDMDGTLDRLNSVFNHAFGVTGTIVEQDSKKIYSMASNAERDKLEFYAKLYADGLLDPGYITDAWDDMEQKFYEGNVGFIAGTAGDVIQVYSNKMVDTHGDAAALTVLPPAKGVSQAYTSIDTTKESRGMAITIDCENPDAAFAVLEFMSSPEGRILDKCGLEGVHYNVENGEIVFTEKFPEWWARIFPTPENLPTETPLAEPVLVPAAQESLDMAIEYMYADTNILVPEDMAAMYDAMMSLYNEYSTDIVTGKADISVWDEFVEKFNAAGGDAFSEYFEANL